MNKNNIRQCNLLISSTKTIYDLVGSIYCPVLKEKVIFNARGFHHLLYNSNGSSRKINEKIYKLTLFPLAIPTIKFATAIVDERKIKIRASRKKNLPLKLGITYALIAKVGKKRPIDIRVILLKIGNGKLMFRSIMRD